MSGVSFFKQRGFITLGHSASKITQKGQVTIPADLRELLNLHPGDKVEFIYKDNQAILVKQKNDISAAFGMLSVDHSVTLDDIQDAISRGPVDDID